MMSHNIGEPLDSPVYAPLDGLTRSIHFSDLKNCYKKEMLLPHKLSSKVVDLEGVKVLWFGPSNCLSKQNMYGNVSFSISMRDLIPRFGSTFYYVDSIVYQTHTVTRLLLSEKQYDQLEEVNLADHGSPLKRSRWRHVSFCDSEHSSVHPHEVEIGIEVNKDDCRWLYNECDVAGNNHADANRRDRRSNKFRHHVCHRFNLFGRTCPYSFTEDRANDILVEQFPNLFCDTDSEDEQSEAESLESSSQSDEDESDYYNYVDYDYYYL